MRFRLKGDGGGDGERTCVPQDTVGGLFHQVKRRSSPVNLNPPQSGLWGLRPRPAEPLTPDSPVRKSGPGSLPEVERV